MSRARSERRRFGFDRRRRGVPVEGAAPILILASGMRCGSTLLQRILCSHPELMIWGEQGGALRELRGRAVGLAEWEERFGVRARQEAGRADGTGFIAHLLPAPEYVRRAQVAFFDELFGAPSRALGKPRWGFKELRYGRPFVEWFTDLFPDAKAIHLTRDPVDVLRSLEDWQQLYSWQEDEIEVGLGIWRWVNESFADLAGAEETVLPVSYERLVAEPAETLGRVAAFVGIESGELDHSQMERRLHGFAESSERERCLADRAEVLGRLRERMPDDAFWELAASYGYDYR